MRTKKNFGIGLSLAFVATACALIALAASAFLPFAQKTAQAAGEDYALYFKNADKDEIGSALASSTKSDNTALRKTSIYVKGGIFNSPYGFYYNQADNAVAPAGKYYYTSTYFCAKDNRIVSTSNAPDSLKITLRITASLSRNSLNNRVINNQDLTVVKVTEGPTDNGFDHTNNLSALPNACFPSNLKSGPKKIQLLNYNEMIPSGKREWPGLKTSQEHDTDTSAPANPTNPGGGGGEDDEDKCLSASAASLLSFGWIACPLLNGLDNIVREVNDVIEGQLNFKVSKYLTPDVEQAWSIIKNLSTAILVIIMLIMVFSQAIGSGPFEAYTIRKVLPRLVAAVILIQVSWELLIFLIRISNDLGQGIKELLFLPFGGGEKMELQNLIARLGDAAPGLTVGAIFTGLVATAAFSGLTVVGVGFLALGAVASILVGFLVLLLRQILIIMCVILAPIAIALWILPGTQRYWKMWSDNFVKLLLMFPIIMAIIAAGRIFAYITAGASDGGEAFLAIFAVLIGFFGPFWFLPKAFKWGGTAMAAVTNAAGTMSKWPRTAPRQFALSQAKVNRSAKAEARNQRLSYNRGKLGDRAITGLGALGLNRRAREQRFARGLAEGREAGQKEIQQALVGSEYETLDHNDKLKSLDLLAQGKYDSITGLNGKDPAVQRWGLGELAKYGDWDRIDTWRTDYSINERVWQDFVAQNIGEIHSKAPHLSPIKRDLSAQSYEESGTWKEWTGDEFVRQITEGFVRSPNGKDLEYLIDPKETDPAKIAEQQAKRAAQLKNGIAFAQGALNDQRVRARLTPKLIADFEKVASMTPPDNPELSIPVDMSGRPAGGVHLPSPKIVGNTISSNPAEQQAARRARQSITTALVDRQTEQGVQKAGLVTKELARQLADPGLEPTHPDRHALEDYIGELKQQAGSSEQAKQAYNDVVKQWNNQLANRVRQAEQAAVAEGKSAAQIIQARNNATNQVQQEQNRLQSNGLTPLP